MGCIGSNVHPQNFKLEEQLKKKYRSAIAKDDILGIIHIPSQENIPANIQISEAGIQWKTIHFCCRYDAAICLDYFLKKSYIENPKDYIGFVNAKTGDGYTCLHLCTIWKAIKCFYVLINYGGLNLLTKNNLQKTSIDTASEYGQKQMLAILIRLKRKYGIVIQWRHNLLQSSPDINIIVNRTIYQQNMQSLRLSIHQQSQTGSYFEQEIVQTILLQKTKNLLDMKRQKLYKKMKQIQMQRNELLVELDIQINEQIVQYGTNFLEEGNKINQNINAVQEQIQQIKLKIELMEKQKQNLLLEKQKRKIDMNNAEIIKKINQTVKKFKAFREKLLKQQLNFEQPLKHQNSIKFQLSYNSKITHQSRDGQGKQNLPVQLREKYNQAKKKESFKDQQFPCCKDSLGGKQFQAKVQKIEKSLTWLRPHEFLNQQFHLFNGISPNDIKQGQLGICYCLATISKYAEKPKKIKQIFYFYDLSIGFYVLRFYTNGKINYVLIDDYFPCHSQTNQPLFSKPIGNQIWVLLIEKAWAKIIGSYFATQKMTPDFFMEDLTGSPTYGDWFKSKVDKMKDILQCYSKNYMIVLTTGSKKIQGIVNNHAYSLLKIISHNNSNIYKVRNPWGRFQWNGIYGDNSPIWNEELKEKCKFVNEDDGIFFLSQSQLLQAFQYYSIGMDESQSIYSYIEVSSMKDEDMFFRFQLKKATKVSIRFTQQFKRLIKDKNYSYSPVIIEIGKIIGQDVKFLSQGNNKCSFGQKSVYACQQIYTQYEQGLYFIRLRIQWNNPNKYNTGVLSIYCGQIVSLENITPQQGQQLWQKLLFNYVSNKKINRLDQNIVYSTSWMRGQLVCYCAIMNEQSKPSSFKVNWHFNIKQLQNCKLSKCKIKEDILQCMLTEQKKYGIGTLQRISISQSCKYGSVSIKTSKL